MENPNISLIILTRDNLLVSTQIMKVLENYNNLERLDKINLIGKIHSCRKNCVMLLDLNIKAENFEFVNLIKDTIIPKLDFIVKNTQLFSTNCIENREEN